MPLPRIAELAPQAQAAVLEWKRAKPTAAGYQFARRAQYLGRWILHSGWYPDYKLRLFDRRRGSWQGAYVHESVVVKGPVATLPGEILHYTCNSLEEHRQRIEFYTDLAAKEMFERGERVSFLRRTLGPPWIFLNSYLLRLGMLDGTPGYLIAKMAARYVQRKYAKLEEMRKSRAPTTMNFTPRCSRIAHIDTGLSLRGGQRQMLMLAQGLRERGHEQVIVCLEGSGLEERAQREGFRVFSLACV